MKYLVVLVMLLISYSCGHTNKTVVETDEVSLDTQMLDSLEKKLPVDERMGCNDTLGISLRPEYSVYPMGTQRTRFYLCNNSGMNIYFGEHFHVTYQDKRGTWRVLPVNYSVADVLYNMRTGDYRFINCPLDSDIHPKGSGHYRCFYEINCNGKNITFMGELRLTNNKKEIENTVRNAPFYISIDPPKNPVEESNKKNVEDKQDSIFNIAEVMPVFPGGMDKLSGFIENSIQYPQQALKNRIQGRVIVRVIINEDGSVTNCHIIRSVDPYLDKEAIRIAKSMPNWKPGRQNGKVVRAQYTFPIMFKLVGN